MNIWNFLLTNALNGFVGILLLLIGFFVFDILTSQISGWHFGYLFQQKGISGGAIVVAVFLLSLSIIIATTGS